MAFNLDDYTSVQERSNIFWERYPNGAVRTNLSRSQTLESFLVVNYLGNQLIRNHLQQALPKNSFRIVVLIVTLRWKIVKLQLEALLLTRLISVLKNMDRVEKKWLESTEKQKPLQ
jgi:hypothetical protein